MDYRQFYLDGDPRYEAWREKVYPIAQAAKAVGADFFNKLSDPPIPCYTFTEKQLEKFAKLIRNPTEQ